MSKIKKPAKVVAKGTTKKSCQVTKTVKAASKTSKIKENGIKAKVRKLKKSTNRRQAPKKADGQKSKYFCKDAKEGSDDESDGSEEVNMNISEMTVVQNKDAKVKEEKDDESEESDDDEWEEVEELAGPSGSGEAEVEPAIPSEPVEIEIEMADVLHKRTKKEKKEKEFEMYLRRVMNRFNKEVLEDTHKVHLLCLLGSGLFRNRICCEPNLLAITLSLIPTNLCTVGKKSVNINYLEGLLKWFKETFSLDPALPEENNGTLHSLLERRLASLSARNHQEMTYLFLLVLRSLQFLCRLVLSLQPLPLKPLTEIAQVSSSPPSKVKDEASVTEPKVSPGSKRPQSDGAKQPESVGKRRKKNNEEEDKKKEPAKKQSLKNTKKGGKKSKTMNEEESSDEEEPSKEEEFEIKSEDESDYLDVKKSNKNCRPKAKGKSQAKSQPMNKKKVNKAEVKEEEPDEPDEETSTIKLSPGTKRPASVSAKGKQEGGGKKQKKNDNADPQNKRNKADVGRSRRSTVSTVSYKDDSSEGDEGLSEDEYKPNFEEDSEVESEEEREIEGEADNSEFEFEVKSQMFKSPNAKGKCQAACGVSAMKKPTKKENKEALERRRKQERMKRRAVKGEDEWIEVYLVGAKKWACVDVVQGVGRPELCTGHASQPITYVVGVDGEGYLKDLSRRYDPTWLTASRKHRIDAEWWEETLKFYEGPDSERNRQEDKELQENLMEKPLPTTITAYKNHPLYVLERHILKFEALYPRTAAILGYFRGEPVYSRDCVHTLRSRDTWLKQARTVQLGEEPYKMVKGFSNRSRKLRMMGQQKDVNDLPLFGLWQTEKYKPPIAVNGRVPRNDFGNVYLYQECMLPVGCAHLRLPNLNRVANKLQIDCVAAVTGFDHHKGHSHPITDGYIVCEENADILRAAWEEEQVIQRKKEQEKREKRAFGNWKLLVKSLLIKERLKKRYGQQGRAKDTGITQTGNTEGFSSDEEDEDKDEAKTAASSLAVSWPQNRQEEPEKGKSRKALSKREKRGEQKHLFPFEKST